MRVFSMLLLTLVAAGSSKADLGEIDSFQIINQTETSLITIEWTLTQSDQPPVKYVLVLDNFISTDVQCQAPCQYSFEYQQTCTQHVLSVTPCYIVNGSLVCTGTAKLNLSPEADPSPVRDLVCWCETNSTCRLEWNDPIYPLCAEKYSIDIYCGPSARSIDLVDHDNHATFSDLMSCTNCTFYVTAVSGEGVQSGVESCTSQTLCNLVQN